VAQDHAAKAQVRLQVEEAMHVAVADEAVDGIPEESLVGFAADVLGEVADIAEAAGLQVKGAQIAKAVQMMLIRFVTEQGLDPTQLQQAMARIH
jgi:hypothetical protein